MNHFINNIHINKLFHLENFDIPIADEKYPHLIITGKNGSGKTILLNAITEFLTNIKDDRGLSYLSWDKYYKAFQEQYLNATIMADKANFQNAMINASNQIKRIFGKVDVGFRDASYIINKYQDGDFIIAMYMAYRQPDMVEPKNPTKPKYNKKGRVTETATNQFLNFMSDLKIQEALARNEKQFDDADKINEWFVEFESLLKQIYQDDNLKLEFYYKDYSFKICTEGKSFKFTELSDGFKAVLDIVADLILKMQDDNSLTKVYQKEGIVLIDEIETHLHLGLQKVIMPLLTKVFPNIQFIVTTHSPFVLNSMDNAVAYDLEHKQSIDDLTNYSYESLAEGYFGVSTESSTVEMRLKRLKTLINQENWSNSDKNEMTQIMYELDKVSEAVSPDLVGEYIKLKLDNINKIKEIS